MLPFSQKIVFLIFAVITLAFGVRGFVRLYRRIRRGQPDTDARFNHLPGRIWYSLVTTLTQSRTFRKRPGVSFFHSFIFYGFAFYILVNFVDAIDGYYPLPLTSLGWAGDTYNLLADILSALVLLGVVALVIRRFWLPSRRDFRFNERTMLHHEVKQQYVTRDSLIVSVFILFHVGSRAIGAGARIAAEGPDRYAPFATFVSHLFNTHNALDWRIFGYWGALGSVLLFLAYFPYSKHLHIFMAPAKYLFKRDVSSGVLPAVQLDLEAEEPKLGAEKLEDLSWPRLLDAYACIQCNRCQDACPATATGKALSPSAIEINKRMELNELALHEPAFENGAPSPRPLLQFALSPEAAWACTTCGACIEVCPVQDDPMLDIIDVRRNQVMIAGEFPAQLQTAFRGMERAQNPWGINHDKRMDWAEGLRVPTTEQNPTPDVLFWVGCAASYDPQSQKTARAFVQLLDHAGVDFAVLGKRECCTGDSARRAGNEYLYRQLADQNVATLNEVRPKLIVATCPHCMNTVGNEYAQLGGDYKVVHHTQYLEQLVAEGRLVSDSTAATVTYHDPCYLGRHNGVYDAPRNVLNILSNSVVELPRNRENSFCCGAGGAQFWKEEEPGNQRISDNRFEEVQRTLGSSRAEEKVLAVGCPFCKSMLQSTPAQGETPIAVKDVAELLLEGVQRRSGKDPNVTSAGGLTKSERTTEAVLEVLKAVTELPVPGLSTLPIDLSPLASPLDPVEAAPPSAPEPRKKWTPTAAPVRSAEAEPAVAEQPAEALNSAASETPASPVSAEPTRRKAWNPKASSPVAPAGATAALESTPVVAAAPAEDLAAQVDSPAPPAGRKVWKPKTSSTAPATESSANRAQPGASTPVDPLQTPSAMPRKQWKPKRDSSG